MLEIEESFQLLPLLCPWNQEIGKSGWFYACNVFHIYFPWCALAACSLYLRGFLTGLLAAGLLILPNPLPNFHQGLFPNTRTPEVPTSHIRVKALRDLTITHLASLTLPCCPCQSSAPAPCSVTKSTVSCLSKSQEKLAGLLTIFLLFNKTFMVELGLHCCAWAFSSCGEPGASHCGGFYYCRTQALELGLSGCGPRLGCLCGTKNLPRLGIEPIFPTLAGGSLTTGPPGKSPSFLLVQMSSFT